jgi:hypothetical protein
MKREDHLKVDMLFYNQKYNEVHQWLDETYPLHMKSNPYRHWLERHNTKALDEKYGLGTVKYNVGYLHVLSDFLSHLGVACVPKNSEECESWLKSWGYL